MADRNLPETTAMTTTTMITEMRIILAVLPEATLILMAMTTKTVMMMTMMMKTIVTIQARKKK